MPTVISWEDEDTGELLTVQFDVTTSVEHEDTSTLTDHPVERGSSVTDSAREEPERLTLEGVVTNLPHQGNPGFSDVGSLGTTELQVSGFAPPEQWSKKLVVPSQPLALSASGLLQAGIGAISNAITGGPDRTASLLRQGGRVLRSVSATTVSYSGAVDRVRDVYETLLTLKARRARAVVTTGMREYFDMVVERVAAPLSADDGDYGKFSVDLRRVFVVSAQTVAAPRPAEARGRAGGAGGSQAAKPDKNPEGKDGLRSTIYNDRHPT